MGTHPTTSSPHDGVVDSFRADGFGVIRQAIPPEEVLRLRLRLEQLLERPHNLGQTPLQRLVPRLVEHDERFADLATRRPLVVTLTELFGVVPHLICSYGHEKPAGTGAHTGPHSDVAHLPGVPHHLSLLMVKVMVALTPVRHGSGPTVIFPGSHRGAHGGEGRSVLLEPGDVLLFHANARHTATTNASTVTRLSLWYVFALPWMRVFPGYEYSADFLDALQPRLTAEPDLRGIYGLEDPYATRPS